MHVTKSLSFKHIAEMFCFGYKICIDEVKCEKKGNKKFKKAFRLKMKSSVQKVFKRPFTPSFEENYPFVLHAATY